MVSFVRAMGMALRQRLDDGLRIHLAILDVRPLRICLLDVLAAAAAASVTRTPRRPAHGDESGC